MEACFHSVALAEPGVAAWSEVPDPADLEIAGLHGQSGSTTIEIACLRTGPQRGDFMLKSVVAASAGLGAWALLPLSLYQTDSSSLSADCASKKQLPSMKFFPFILGFAFRPRELREFASICRRRIIHAVWLLVLLAGPSLLLLWARQVSASLRGRRSAYSSLPSQ